MGFYFKNKFNFIELNLERRTFWVYVFLTVFYCANYLPNIFAVLGGFPSINFPLDALYIANNLLFPNAGLNPELAKTIISPSNISFIYPPGIHLLAKILGNVSNIFIFLFILQLAVPLLIFRLLRSVSSVSIAMFCSLLATCFFVNPNCWSPDFIIQPIMSTVILLLMIGKGEENSIRPSTLAVIGFLSGLIIIIKHNIGVFFVIVCITLIFLRSLGFYDNKVNKRQMLFIVLVGYFSLGVIFLSKVMYFDEVVFFLFPYFLFWGIVTCLMIKNRSCNLNVPKFFKGTLIFTSTSLVLPVSIFFWFGSVIGYARYWHSLFGMGFEYLPMWDIGIVRNLGFYWRDIVKAKNINLFTQLRMDFALLARIGLHLFPFIVNCFIGIKLFSFLRGKATSSVGMKKCLEVTSMGIMSMFMFFPLEGYHILSTKLFIFCFITFFLISKQSSEKLTAFIKPILIILVVPIIMYSVIRPIKAFKQTTSYGSNKLQNVIGMPMRKELAEELDKQVAVIERSIKGNQYYVIDTTGATLTSLLAIVNNSYPQYYLEMRKEVLNQEVTDTIISTISRLPFVLIDYSGYNDYLHKQQNDPCMAQIMDYIFKNYNVVDRYNVPEDKSPAIHMMDSFLILQNCKWQL